MSKNNSMKVAILNPSIPHYRMPIFELLSKHVQLTIIHNDIKSKVKAQNFTIVTIRERCIGPFRFSGERLNKLLSGFDVVISEANIRYIDRNILIWNPLRKYRWITWGIGVSSSYHRNYDESQLIFIIKSIIFAPADCHLFYSNYPIGKYKLLGYDPDSMFVAPNTVQISSLETCNTETSEYDRRRLLFVGTLYAQKGITILLEAYKLYRANSTSPMYLDIVGSGEQYESIEKYIEVNELSDHVQLHGRIEDANLLHNIYTRAIACISPNQAGLSVLSAMAHGIPFICQKDAITGGERLNIIDGFNGVLYRDHKDLPGLLNQIENNRELYLQMGRNSQQYYNSCRTKSHMVCGMVAAIAHAIRK